MTNTTLLYNVTNSIGDAFKGIIGTNEAFGYIIVGIVILLIFIYWIFSSGIGLWGLIVIVPPLIIILSFIPGQEENSLGFLPAWVGAIVWIMVGAVWGLIILRFFREG
jgi:hypothetical protein